MVGGRPLRVTGLRVLNPSSWGLGGLRASRHCSWWDTQQDRPCTMGKAARCSAVAGHSSRRRGQRRGDLRSWILKHALQVSAAEHFRIPQPTARRSG